MTSAVQISNMALSLIGARSQIASIDPPDGSVEAGLCATFLPVARRLAIENGVFPFANKRMLLARLTDNPSRVWQFAYALPTDCLIPIRIVRNTMSSKAALFMAPEQIGGMSSMLNEAGSADFYWEDGVLYSSEADAVLLYKRDVVDTRFYTPGFEATVAMSLASLLAGPLIGGTDGMRIGASWTERAAQQARIASANNANASQSTALHNAPWMTQR